MELTLKFMFWFFWWTILFLVGILTPIYKYYFLTFSFGILFIFYGMVLIIISGKTLKKYGNPDKMIPKKLVMKGIYSCMRHPMQLGFIFIGVGISLITNSLFSLLFAGWYVASVFYFILFVEEPETYGRFGKKYLEYMKRVPPFRIWCKIKM